MKQRTMAKLGALAAVGLAPALLAACSNGRVVGGTGPRAPEPAPFADEPQGGQTPGAPDPIAPDPDEGD